MPQCCNVLNTRYDIFIGDGELRAPPIAIGVPMVWPSERRHGCLDICSSRKESNEEWGRHPLPLLRHGASPHM